MKKLLALIAIAGFVACNNETKEEAPAVDTPAVEAPATVDTTAPATVDTTAPAAAPAAEPAK
ncbi:MAG: hypothetical protein MUF12_09060 [Sediminibacterium sp.]|jgi:hypothetical protein|nr:hypothetical protein [Sediminibacterium sp.]